MKWCLFKDLFKPNTPGWILMNTLLHGEWEFAWFDKWEGMSYGFNGPDYYDGYHMSFNTYIFNIYIYW
jgi:hypothetical protein